MPAARSTGESKGLFVALIIFVVLFLGATVFAVVLFMNTEELKQSASTADQELAEMANTAQVRALKPLVQRSGGRISQTAMSRVAEDMKYLAACVAGPDVGEFDVAGVRSMVESRSGEVMGDVGILLGKEVPQDASEVGLTGVVQKLMALNVRLAEQTNRQANTMQASIDSLEQQVAAKTEGVASLEKQLAEETSRAAQFKKQYDELASEQSERFKSINTDVRDRNEALQQNLDQLQKTHDKQAQELAKAQGMIEELRKQLQDFKARPETEMAALETDGYIVQVVAREKLAYINLHRGDHIYRGLTFAVYDRYEPVPKAGQGKGALEVIEIMDNIAKCRITEMDTANPIMDRDNIANLVWSKEKRYQFCVVGEFDLNGDGKVDGDGRAEVVKMIDQWGGQASDVLSVDTDFLVVGSAPKLPERQGDAFLDLQGGVGEGQEYEQAQKRREAYKQTIESANALDVPTFNLSRFLYFVGQPQRAGVVKVAGD